MKRFIAAALAVSMIFALAGCRLLPFGNKKQTATTTVTLPDGLDVDIDLDVTIPSISGYHTTTTIDWLTTTTQTPSGIQIPDIYGVDEASAKNILLSNLLIPFVQYETSDVVVKGNVIRVEPEVGTYVEPNSKITIYVSQGVAGISRLMASYSSDYSTHQADIVLSTDMTFELQVNLYEGYGKIWGTYIIENSSLLCTVTGKDFSGFAGEELSNFTLYPNGGGYTVVLGNVDAVGALFDGSKFS